MRILKKKFGTLAVAILALSAIFAANASAAQFTASATGNFTGAADATGTSQIFHFPISSGQNVVCNTALSNGTINALATTELSVVVQYSNCIGFTGVSMNITPASYTFIVTGGSNSNHVGNLRINNPIVIKNTFPPCNQVIAAQTVGTVTFNNVSNTMTVDNNIVSLQSTGNGAPCGTSTTNNGTYIGNIVLGSTGVLSFDAS